MGKGLLLVLDGVDCSFKQTNCLSLANKLKQEGFKVKELSFPDYNSNSSALVKMYLSGEFGTNPNDVNPYAASLFYAVDRYASFKSKWEQYYNDSYILIADRYVTSNMLHQACKLPDISEKEKFLDWLYDLEYLKNAIPIPDMTIFLDMPPEIGSIINEQRANKISGSSQKDIHENNFQYLKESYNNALWIAEKYSWSRVSCVKTKTFNLPKNELLDSIKSKEEMLDEIYNLVYPHILRNYN